MVIVKCKKMIIDRLIKYRYTEIKRLDFFNSGLKQKINF